MSEHAHGPDVAKFYTSARRFPILFGKLPNGGRVWGGPYTLVQVGVGTGAIALCWFIRPVWSTGSIITDLVITITTGAAALWLSGKIPASRRQLGNIALDVAIGASASRTGTYQGRPVRELKPHYVGGSVLIMDTPTTAPAIAAAPVADVDVTPDPTPAPATAATLPEPEPISEPLPDNVIPITRRTMPSSGLSRLLEQARKDEAN